MTVAIEALLDGEAEALTRIAIDLAKGSPATDGCDAVPPDLTALRLCLDRLCPPQRDRAVALDLPSMTSAADHPKVMSAIVDAVATSQITPRDAVEVSKLVEIHQRALEIAEIDERLTRLERETAKS